MKNEKMNRRDLLKGTAQLGVAAVSSTAPFKIVEAASGSVTESSGSIPVTENSDFDPNPTEELFMYQGHAGQCSCDLDASQSFHCAQHGPSSEQILDQDLLELLNEDFGEIDESQLS